MGTVSNRGRVGVRGVFRAAVERLERRRLLAASSGFVPPTMPQTATNFTQVVKVLVLNYDPTVPSQGNRRLHEVQGWNDPHALAAGYEADMEYASGGALDYQVVEFRDLNELPANTNGYRINGDEYVQAWPTRDFQEAGADYYRIAAEQNVAPLINAGQVDEIWMFSAPFHAGTWESWMYGPESFFINGGTYPDVPIDRAVAMFGFNYERGVAEMLHDNGHRTENHMVRSFGGTWNGTNPSTAWERFSALAKNTPNGVGGVGNTHFPVNGAGDYDYSNTTPVASTANDWLNYPNLTGATTTVSRTAWAGPSGFDDHRDYLQWFFGHLPRNTGTTPDGRQNNWYKYIYDFNSYEPTTGLPRHESAVLGAATLRGPTGTSHDFTVRYYDQTGVNPTTLDGNDLQVTGPGGFSQLATLVSAGTARTTTAGTARTVTYRITAPGGAWDAADAGRFTVNMRSNQVRDTLGNAVASGRLGAFNVEFPDPSRIDVNALVVAGQATVTGTAPDIGSFASLFDGDSDSLYRTANVNPAVVQVAFASPQTVRGFRLLPSENSGTVWTVETADTQADLNNKTGSWRRAVPNTSTPGGSFSTVMLAAPVSARFVKLTAERTIGDDYVHLYEFAMLGPAVNDAAAPAAALSAANVTSGGGATHLFNVTYTDATAVDVATVRNGNLRVTGPNGFDQPAIFYDLNSYTNGPSRTAAYFVAAPGGSWTAADNGTYTVRLQPSQVRDTVGNAAAAAALGTFTVNVPPPQTRPPADLAELNASDWSAGGEGGATGAVTDDTVRKTTGAASVKFVTTGGFDAFARYAPQQGAAWDLRGATTLSFDVFAENPSPFDFQRGVLVRLMDDAGNYFEYEYYRNGSPATSVNEAVGQWRSNDVPLNASATTATGWRRTAVGNPSLANISSVEFHADTWDYGYTLWLDGIEFDLPSVTTVVDRHVFYNNSSYDGNNPAANAADDAAVAAGKEALLPGAAATATNITGYSKGINGVMIDVLNLPQSASALTATDFQFRTGNTTAPANWPLLPAGSQPSVDVRRGGGVNGSDRITLTWTDGAITNKWLQVTVPAGGKVGLAAADVFYFGNLVGDADGSRTVNLGDFGALRQDFGGTNVTVAAGRSDFNRDRAINLADFGLLRANFGKSLAAPVTTTAVTAVTPQVPPSSAAASADPGQIDKRRAATRRPADDLASGRLDG